jgi:F-type H+-transporting ATPase subunit b
MRTLRLSRLQRILIFALAALAGAADLWAAGGGEKGGFSSEVIWQIISFVLLIVLLSRFVKKPLAAFLSGRQAEVQNAIEQSARKKEEAEALLSEWQRKVDSLGREIQDLHQRIRAEGEAEQKKIVSRAQEEGERIRQQAGVIAEQELTKVRAALKKEMVDLSVELAEKLLKEAIQPQDQERLIQEYIGKVRELR